MPAPKFHQVRVCSNQPTPSLPFPCPPPPHTKPNKHLQFFTAFVAAAAGLNAGAAERINWAEKIEAHNQAVCTQPRAHTHAQPHHTTQTTPYAWKWGPGQKLPEEYKVLF